MKRLSCIVYILFLLSALSLAALEVDRDELGTVDAGSVEFLNYEGPHTVINTRNEIISIGRILGARLGGEFGTFRYHEKYSVIHAVGPEDEAGIPADIFIIEKEAGVDHIRNLRRIVAGYLSAAYDYDFETAVLIAEFTTIYNAVYRRDMDMVSSKYSATVLANLEPEKMGISTRYDQWPGNTMMLIPLTGGPGRRGIVSSEEISSDEVIERLREEDDRGIEQRKGMVELREEESEAEQDRIAWEMGDLEEEEKALKEREAELEKEIEKAKEEGTGEEGELEEELGETRERLKETEEQRQELAEEEKEQEERVDRIREERERIAEDETALIEETAAPRERPEAGTLFLIYSEKGGIFEGTFVRVDPVTGSVKKRAQGVTVLGRGYTEYSGGLLVLGSASDGFVTILSVDEETLEVLAQGTERIHPDSNVVVSGKNIYAAVLSSGEPFLGRFDGDLEILDRSADPIVPYSYIKITGDTIMVQSERGDVIILDAETLEAAD